MGVLLSVLVEGRLDLLGLLDRHVRGRRGRALEGAPGEQPRSSSNQQEEGRLDEEAGPEVVEDEVVEEPGETVHQHRQGQQDEDARREPGHRAAQKAVELLGDLGLGELDLLADQDRSSIGDLEDELAHCHVLWGLGGHLLWGLGAVAGGRSLARPSGGDRLLRLSALAVGHSGGSSLNTRRQITSESRCAATVASAPVAASKPPQISRLKISLSIALPSSPGSRYPGSCEE